MLWFTRSNAFLRSTNKSPFRTLLSILLRRRSIRSVTASSQERDFLKPNWESESRSFSVRKLTCLFALCLFGYCLFACCLFALCLFACCLFAWCLFALCLFACWVFAWCLFASCLFACCLLAWCLSLRDTYMIVAFLLFLPFSVAFFFCQLWLGIFQIWRNPFHS